MEGALEGGWTNGFIKLMRFAAKGEGVARPTLSGEHCATGWFTM